MNSGKDYKARETDVAQPIMAGGPVGGNQGGDFIVAPFDTTQVTSPHNYSNPKAGDPCHPLAAGAHPPAIAIQDVRGLDKAQNGKGWSDEGVSYTVDTHATQGVAHPIAFSAKDHGGDATEEMSPTLRAGGHSGSHANAGVMPAVAFQTTADCLTAAYGTKWNGNASATNGSLFAAHPHAVQTIAFKPGSSAEARSIGAQEEVGCTLEAGGGGNNRQAIAMEFQPDQSGVAFTENIRGEVRLSEQTNALTGGGGKPGQGYAAAQIGSAVRRLTPVECERLQGFPDNFTAIPWKKKDADNCPDGPRYKALGNSMAVPVMRWIGERIQLVDDLTSLL